MAQKFCAVKNEDVVTKAAIAIFEVVPAVSAFTPPPAKDLVQKAFAGL